jgi:hypothetical protein
MHGILTKISEKGTAFVSDYWGALVAVAVIMALSWLCQPVREVVKAFFNIHEKDDMEDVGMKVSGTLLKRIGYAIADYWLAGLCAAANIALKVYGTPLGWAFVVMWGINIVIAGVFFAIYVKSDIDVSLGRDLRRAVDVVHGKSKLLGYASVFGVLFQAIYWSGPEQLVIFFQKEIGSRLRSVMVLFFLTALQTVIWMYLYRTGYDVLMS